MKRIMLIILLALVVMGGFAIQAKDKANNGKKTSFPDVSKADSIVWMSYADATAKAAAEDKHVLIHFTTKTCGWCRKMERETYTDANVIKMVNTYFAPVVVWADSHKKLDIEGLTITERDLAKSEFGVSSYPQFWFVTPEKKKVGPLKGYLPASRFIQALEFVKNYDYDTTRTDNSQPEGKSSK